MVAIDFLGLVATIVLIGLRYPHYVLLAICIYECSRIFIAIFLHAHIHYIIAAGAFGSLTTSHVQASAIGFLILFSGSLANYIVSLLFGGIAFERTASLLNPLATLRYPFAVVNFRLCILSCVIQTWKIFI